MSLYCKCGEMIDWNSRKFLEPSFCYKCKREKDQGWGEGMKPDKRKVKKINDSTSKLV